MIAAGYHDKLVLRHVLAHDIPSLAVAAAALHSAYAYALPLADGEERKSDMLTDHPAFGRAYRAGGARQIAVEEFAERSLADETDAGRVLLRVHRQSRFPGDPAHLGFLQLRQRENRTGELRLAQTVQEIALVLVPVRRPEQLVATRILSLAGFAHAGTVSTSAGAHTTDASTAITNAGAHKTDASTAITNAGAHKTDASVVPGGDAPGAEREVVIEKGPELDFGIAQYVRIGRAPGLVLGEEGAEHALLVLGGEIHRFELDADHVRNRRAIDQVLARRTIRVIVVVFPVLHEQADDLEAGALQ